MLLMRYANFHVISPSLPSSKLDPLLSAYKVRFDICVQTLGVGSLCVVFACLVIMVFVLVWSFRFE